MTTNTKKSIEAVREALRASILERNEEIDAVLAAAISGHHVVQIGEPGAAKSMLARALATAIGDSRYFEILMARSTEPSELFGAKDIEAMKQGRTRRNLEGTVADAHVVMLDEVFKGHSAILNSLLGVLNERIYANGAGGVVKVPLRFAMAASNEVPSQDDTTLGAFYDRFLVRLRVGYLQGDDAFAKLMRRDFTAVTPGVATLQDLDDAKDEAATIVVEDDAIVALRKVILACRSKSIAVSDRRALAIVDFMKARAWLAGDDTVTASSVGDIASCLWSRIDQIQAVEEIVKEHAPSWRNEARDIRRQLNEQLRAVAAACDLKSTEEIVAKLTPINRILKTLEGDVDDRVARHSRQEAEAILAEIGRAREAVIKANAAAYAL